MELNFAKNMDKQLKPVYAILAERIAAQLLPLGTLYTCHASGRYTTIILLVDEKDDNDHYDKARHIEIRITADPKTQTIDEVRLAVYRPIDNDHGQGDIYNYQYNFTDPPLYTNKELRERIYLEVQITLEKTDNDHPGSTRQWTD